MKTGFGLLLVLLIGTSVDAQDFPFDQFRSFRVQSALPMPSWNQKLARSSQNRASQLLMLGELSHFDGQGRGPGIQMTREGLPPGTYGEVLGAGADPVKVWEAWLASPTHRAVLADPWTSWGSGQASAGGRVVYVVRFWRQ